MKKFEYPQYGLKDLYMVIYDNKDNVMESEISFKDFKELKETIKILKKLHIHFELLSYTFMEKKIREYEKIKEQLDYEE
jgi:hypothetical protein